MKYHRGQVVSESGEQRVKASDPAMDKSIKDPPGDARGVGRQVTIGLVAQGRIAVGVIAMGGVSIGIVALGGIAVGVVAIGGLSLGVLALGGIAIGWRAIGAVTMGLAALGGAIKWGYSAAGLFVQGRRRLDSQGRLGYSAGLLCGNRDLNARSSLPGARPGAPAPGQRCERDLAPAHPDTHLGAIAAADRRTARQAGLSRPPDRPASVLLD